jgi:hypothetical protein
MPGFAIDSPRYLDPALDTDSLMRMILELASEVWVQRDRLEIIEHFLDERGQVTRADIDEYVPTDETKDALAAGRRQFVERLLSAAQHGSDPATPAGS